MNRLFITAAIALLALPVFAQTAAPAPAQAQIPQMPAGIEEQMKQFQSLTPAQQQQMINGAMATAQQLQACLDEVGGQAGLQVMEARAKAAEDKTRALCAVGNRDGAAGWSKIEMARIENDPQTKKLALCSKDVMGTMPSLNKIANPAKRPNNIHICDQL